MVRIRPRVLGVPPGGARKKKPRWKRCGRFISPSRKPCNNAKALETGVGLKSFSFSDLIAAASVKILELFLGAAWPFNLYALDFRVLSQAERDVVNSYFDTKYGMQDSDGDSLPDWKERQIGTDPYNPDTNSDGIPDGIEYLSGLDPTNMDIDGDGLTNAQELVMGTNPFSADTDGDGVPDGQDAFPLDPTRWQSPVSDPNDHTPPTITLVEPADAVLLP